MAAAGCIHVVAAAVTAADGRVLIAQRPPGKHLAGSWEFPGGKLEAGESRAHGLARELEEELGIAIREPRPLIRVQHSYPHGDVLIDMWVVSRFSGEPRGLDGQALRWCTQDEVARADLLAADRPIVRALRLPERLDAADTTFYRVTAGNAMPAAGGCGFPLRGAACANPREAHAAADAGADFIVMCDWVAQAELCGLAESLSMPVFARGIALESAWQLGCTGVSEIDTPSGV